jgi:hypothetical protein
VIAERWSSSCAPHTGAIMLAMECIRLETKALYASPPYRALPPISRLRDEEKARALYARCPRFRCVTAGEARSRRRRWERIDESFANIDVCPLPRLA